MIAIGVSRRFARLRVPALAATLTATLSVLLGASFLAVSAGAVSAGDSSGGPPSSPEAPGLSNLDEVVDIVPHHSKDGLSLEVHLRDNTPGVPSRWLAEVALGAYAEQAHTDEVSIVDYVLDAKSVGPGRGGKGRVEVQELGVGASMFGQDFGEPSRQELLKRASKAAHARGLSLEEVKISHPLQTAMEVTMSVTETTPQTWQAMELFSELVGTEPDVEGALLRVLDESGEPLLLMSVAYRTGESGLWVKPSQSDNLGLVRSPGPWFS